MIGWVVRIIDMLSTAEFVMPIKLFWKKMTFALNLNFLFFINVGGIEIKWRFLLESLNCETAVYKRPRQKN